MYVKLVGNLLTRTNYESDAVDFMVAKPSIFFVKIVSKINIISNLR